MGLIVNIGPFEMFTYVTAVTQNQLLMFSL